MKPNPAIVEPTVDEIKAAGLDPGPRTWTRTGRKLGVPQCDGGDGHIFADWPAEIRRNHRVYFVQAGDPDADGGAAIKIGFTTDLDRRLRQLQTAHPEPLKIIERVIGTRAIEAFFHRLLRPQRIQGEWYRLWPDDISEATVRLYEAGLWS